MRAPAGDQFRRTAATAGVQQAPGRSQVPKGRGKYSKGSKTHPRLSPAETQPSCDASRHRPTGRSVLHSVTGRRHHHAFANPAHRDYGFRTDAAYLNNPTYIGEKYRQVRLSEVDGASARDGDDVGCQKWPRRSRRTIVKGTEKPAALGGHKSMASAPCRSNLGHYNSGLRLAQNVDLKPPYRIPSLKSRLHWEKNFDDGSHAVGRTSDEDSRVYAVHRSKTLIWK